MEFIKAEEFLGKPVEIQKVLMEWWKPSIGDLYIDTAYNGIDDTDGILVFEEFQEEDLCAYGRSTFSFKNDCVPLLSEGQLRQFIEDKIGYMDIEVQGKDEDAGKIHYQIECYEYVVFEGFVGKEEDFNFWENNLLQAYWKVAIEIAKED